MLFRMYSRWAEQKGYKLETVDLLPGEEAGLKKCYIYDKWKLCLW